MAGGSHEPVPFVLAGRIDAVDPARRTLRIGVEDLTVAPGVSLDGLAAGSGVVLSGHRDPETGSARVQHIVPSASGGAARTTDAAHAPPEARELMALVVALLIEIRGEARAVECELRPLDRYAVRVRIPGEVGKEVLLPRRMLERALVDPTALRSVRNVLRASVEILRSQRALSTLRETRYRMGLEASSWTGPRCGRCAGPLFVEEPIVVQGAVRRHMACPPSW